jgi:hypothetical protein
MNRTTTSTSNKSSVTVSPTASGQRTTKEPIQRRNTTPQVAGSPQKNINLRIDPQLPVNPRLAHHRGARVLTSTVSLDSFNSPNNINNNTITNNSSPNNIDGGTITNLEDKNITPTRRLRTRATEKKQTHKLNTTVYKIFCDDGGLHQGYICGFDAKEGYYKIKYQDGNIDKATKEEVYRTL